MHRERVTSHLHGHRYDNLESCKDFVVYITVILIFVDSKSPFRTPDNTERVRNAGLYS